MLLSLLENGSIMEEITKSQLCLCDAYVKESAIYDFDLYPMVIFYVLY